MKKLASCFFFVMMCSSLGIADTSGTVSRALPASVSSETKNVAARTNADNSASTVARTTVSRSTSVQAGGENSNTASTGTVARTGTVSRVVQVTPSASSNNTVTTSSTRGDSATVSRTAAVSRAAGAVNTASQRDSLEAAVSTVGRNARVSEASMNNNPAIRRAGLSLRPTTAEVGGRATIGNTGIQTGSNIASEVRNIQSRAATTSTTTLASAESIAEAKTRLEQTADLNKSCQQQYNDCMDQFCAVVDANQKRCSCSSNLAQYSRVEAAVKDANNQLNEVAQRIRYVGLSADEISAIMSATEAEEALSTSKDNTESRSMLEEIEKLIQDPSSASTSTSTDSFAGLDLDLDFSSDSADLFNLDFLNSNSSSMSKLRGKDLYEAAKKRCSSIITECKEVGANSQQISANYDLAIDKDCIAYEQGLTKMNDTLKSNVRSANLMLQKARLAVLQNKNQYDAKGCIAALDTCMKDDMVCGSDYTKCLDPTKKYIDENGNVVLGQNITNITAFMENYNNAAINKDFLSSAYSVVVSDTECKKDSVTGEGGDGSCNVKYLLQKIGTKQEVTDEGLCRAVLDKCQNYTYDSNGNYQPYNDVVVNYIQRAMVNIRAAQQSIISNYASSCVLDLANCYNQQVTQVNSWSSSASVDSVYRVMTGACRNVALTCAYAVFANDADSCPSSGAIGDQNKCLESISEMFYQTLLCPDNSTYDKEACSPTEGSKATGCVNDMCKCIDGYVVNGSRCLKKCGTGATHNSYGTCVCIDSSHKMDANGDCAAVSSP